MPTKHTIATIKQDIEAKGYTFDGFPDGFKNCDSKVSFKCKCGHTSSMKFSRFLEGRLCTGKECDKQRRVKKCMELHGVTHKSKLQSVQDKKRETCMKVYGVAQVYLQPHLLDKRRTWNIEMVREYMKGAECQLTSQTYLNTEDDVEFICFCGSPAKIPFDKFIQGGRCNTPKCIQQRSKETSMANFGVEHPSQSKEIQEKIMNTSMKNHGVPHPMQNEEIKNKAIQNQKATVMERYNVDTIMKVKAFRDMCIQACIEKYGSENPMHDADVSQHALNMACKGKTFTFPSGRTEHMQGYEPEAIDLLLDFYDEDEIRTKRSEMPEIFYVGDDARYKRYYPDFYLPNENLIVEVKSWYTYQNNFRNTDIKRKACEYLGFEYILIMFNEKKELIKFI